MIKANELRIGNLVLVTKQICPVRTIHLYEIKVYYIEPGAIDCDFLVCDPEVDIDPIPLTPEILKKCGFEWVEDWSIKGNDGTTYRLTIPQNGLKLETGMMGWAATLIDREGLSTGSHVDYLHQLQNLYFALTGEELKVKTSSSAFAAPAD